MAHTVIDINQDRRIVDMSNTIHLLVQVNHPCGVTAKIGERNRLRCEFKWLEQGDIEM